MTKSRKQTALTIEYPRQAHQVQSPLVRPVVDLSQQIHNISKSPQQIHKSAMNSQQTERLGPTTDRQHAHLYSPAAETYNVCRVCQKNTRHSILIQIWKLSSHVSITFVLSCRVPFYKKEL